MVQSRVLSMLSLSRKAGKLLVGFDMVKEGVQRGEVFLVVYAKDLSVKTRERMQYFLDNVSPKVTGMNLRESMSDIQSMWGKTIGILAVTDRGLAQKIVELLGEKRS